MNDFLQFMGFLACVALIGFVGVSCIDVWVNGSEMAALAARVAMLEAAGDEPRADDADEESSAAD